MNLRTKIMLSLLGVTVGLTIVIVVAIRTELLRRFTELETREIRSELLNLDETLSDRLDGIDSKVADWALWGDCHDYCEAPNPQFIEQNVTAAWMDEGNCDVILFVDRQGAIIDGRELEPGSNRLLALSDALRVAVQSHPVLMRHPAETSAIRGLMAYDGHPWLIASRPSLDDAGGGPIHGAVIMARRLDAAMLGDLSRSLGRNITLVPKESVHQVPQWEDAQVALTAGRDLPVLPVDDQWVAGFLGVRDLQGVESWMFRLEAPRTVWLQGVASVRVLIGVVVAMGLLLTGVAWLLLERLVCARLIKLDRQVSAINMGNDRVDIIGDDEISHLGLSFNRVFTELQEANARLADARDESLSASQTKADMLAAVSHEFRTPLNGIIGMSRLLSGAKLGDEQRELVEVIRSSGDNLLALVNDLLDVSRLEVGKLELEMLVFDPRSVVEEAILLHAERAQSKDVQLAAIVDANLPRHVMGDPGRFRQIIHNIVGNAVKFTERGEVVVRLQPAPKLSSSKSVGLCLIVRDSGSGIPKSVQDRIFQRYSHSDSSTARRAGGSGLGLAISKQLAERMGGGIGLETIPQTGTTLTVHVQLGRVEATPASDHGGNGIASRRVLVIDSHGPTREALRHSLRTIGYDIDEAPDLANARLLIGTGGDYIVALVSTSAADDISTPEHIRRSISEVTGAIPLILLSSLAQRRKYIDMPSIAAVLSKPVRRVHLRDAFHRLMSGSVEGPRATIDPLGDDSGSRSGLRVLVVDDSHINQRVAAGMLKRLGCVVDMAGNGLEGLEALRRRRYDLVLLDCQMPVMDGYAMAETWRREEDKQRKIMIVALTADATTGARDRCLSVGMDDYLVKPVDFDALASTVRRAVSHRSDDSGKLPALTEAILPRPSTGELDKNLLNQVRILGDDGFRKVIDRYLEAMPPRIDALVVALDTANIDQVGMLAHQMVGESGLVGLRRVEYIAREIELAARSDKRLLINHIPMLRAAFARGKELLLIAREEPGDDVQVS